MPHAFDGLFFDLFAFLRQPRANAEAQKPVERQEGQQTALDPDAEPSRRIQDEATFWGLVAFPTL